jgi:parvulin-like peptidyl-prolyl isomerase
MAMKDVTVAGKAFRTLVLMALAAALTAALHGTSNARVVDTVVAFIDNQAITMSELDERYAETLKAKPDITKRQVLETMINRVLLLRAARRLRLEAPTDEQLLQDYIDLKVEAFIRVSDSDIRNFYEENAGEFGGKPLSAVRDQIEKYLREKEINHRLKQHLKELREKAYIKVLLDSG